MAQGMEQSHVPERISRDPPKEEKEKDKKKRIKVRVSLYYDGTQNNRANTNVRKNVERGQGAKQSSADYEKSLDLFAKHGMKGSSYDNDESNVSRMEGQSVDTASGYDFYFHVYTEGAGTLNEGGDDVLGLALGAFDTGIYAKVDSGLDSALNKMRKKLPPGAVIEELALDTCGFSRGAATARFAIHRVLNGEKKKRSPMKESLEGSGFEVELVKVLAVCLFDTVSSYGLVHKNDVKELKLDAISQAKAVLQLAAAEEYRENFSLTPVKSAKNGRQVYLPGAHSDVGGCYEDGMVEDTEIFVGPGSDDIAKFLLDRGWYTERQLTHVVTPPDVPVTQAVNYLKVKRSGLLKEYSYIPLHIMAAFAVEQGLEFASVFEQTFPVRTIDAALVAQIKQYAKSASDSKASDWEMPRADLNRLRNRYLHVSFHTGIGMGVRVAKSGSFWNRSYRPYRKIYDDA